MLNILSITSKEISEDVEKFGASVESTMTFNQKAN